MHTKISSTGGVERLVPSPRGQLHGFLNNLPIENTLDGLPKQTGEIVDSAIDKANGECDRAVEQKPGENSVN